MAKKKSRLPTPEQQAILKNHGLNKITWEVVQDLPDKLDLRHRITGERRVVDKHGPVHP